MRENGYYWVKFAPSGTWETVYFDGFRYYATNSNAQWDDFDFEIINETRIKTPDEQEINIEP